MNDNITNIFKEIYNEYGDGIFRFCLVRVSDREQALDLTQETFLRFWNTLQKGEKVENNRAFLYTVTRRLIIDWYRKKKSISLDHMMDDENVPYDLPDEKSIDMTEFGAEGRLLIAKINILPPTYRDPVYLRFVEDLSPKEIGNILYISENAASVRINRGLEELRKITGYSNK